MQLALESYIFDNLNYYASIGGSAGSLLQGVVLGIALLWVLLQFYTLPYLALLETPRLWRALRRAPPPPLARPFYPLPLAPAVGGSIIVLGRLPALLPLGPPAET